MSHVCGPECECRIDLDAAAAALSRASDLLSASVCSQSTESIESRYASLRAAELKLKGAMAAFRDHIEECRFESRIAV